MNNVNYLKINKKEIILFSEKKEDYCHYYSFKEFKLTIQKYLCFFDLNKDKTLY